MNCMYQENECSSQPMYEEIIFEEFICLEPEVQSRIDLYKLDKTWFVTHEYNQFGVCLAC